jgi:hypothetical protein
MKAFLHNANPMLGWSDLRDQLVRPQPHKWPFLALSAAMTFTIFSVMFHEGAKGPPRPPQIIYIESWRADRSDAEIIAGNIKATKEREDRAAAEAASQERVRQMYKALGRVSGMDVDKIEREAKADQAREAAAKAKQEPAVRPRIERVN